MRISSLALAIVTVVTQSVCVADEPAPIDLAKTPSLGIRVSDGRSTIAQLKRSGIRTNLRSAALVVFADERAFSRGIRIGQLITKVGFTTISDRSTFETSVNDLKIGEAAKLLVYSVRMNASNESQRRRGGATSSETFEIPVGSEEELRLSRLKKNGNRFQLVPFDALMSGARTSHQIQTVKLEPTIISVGDGYRLEVAVEITNGDPDRRASRFAGSVTDSEQKVLTSGPFRLIQTYQGSGSSPSGVTTSLGLSRSIQAAILAAPRYSETARIVADEAIETLLRQMAESPEAQFHAVYGLADSGSEFLALETRIQLLHAIEGMEALRQKQSD